MKFLIPFLLILSSFLQAQDSKPYTINHWLEDDKVLEMANHYLYEKNDYKNALKYFKQSKRHPIDHSMPIAECYLYFQDTTNAIKYIETAISKGFNSKFYLKNRDFRHQFEQPSKEYDKCVLLNMMYNDQIVRNPDFKFNKYITQQYDCMYNDWETKTLLSDREMRDSINLVLLDSLRLSNNYPTISNVYNGFVLDIAPSIIIHQDKLVNDIYIKYYEALAKKKEIPYYQLFNIIGNRLKRFSDDNGCTVIQKSNLNYDLLLCYVYSGYLICENNRLDCSMEINKKYRNRVDDFVKRNKMKMDRVQITYSDIEDLKVCFSWY